MARIRTTKPGFWSHPIMGRLDGEVKCLALALLNFSDDEGYFFADASKVRSECRPFDQDTIETQRTLRECARSGWIEVRKHETHGLVGKVVNFTEHQAISRPTKSRIKTYFDLGSPHGALTDRSRQEGKGKGRGKEEKQNPPVANAPVDERRSAVREAIRKGYCWANKVSDPLWGPAEEVALNSFLADVPKTYTTEMLVGCVRNRFLSDDGKSEHPRKWIRLLMTWKDSPFDRFGKPKSLGATSNGRQAIGDKENARRASTVEVLRERAVGRRAGAADGRDGSELSDRAGTINQKSLPDGMGGDSEGQGDRGLAAGIDSLPEEPGPEVLPEPKRSSRGVTDSSISPAFRSLRPAVVVS